MYLVKYVQVRFGFDLYSGLYHFPTVNVLCSVSGAFFPIVHPSFMMMHLSQILGMKNIIDFHEIIMFGISPMKTEFSIVRGALFRRNVSRFAIFLAISGDVRRVIEGYVKPHERNCNMRWRRAAHAGNCQVPCVLSCCTSQVSTRTATTLHLSS